MLIGLDKEWIEELLLIIVYLLVEILYLIGARNKVLYLSLVQNKSIELWLIHM